MKEKGARRNPRLTGIFVFLLAGLVGTNVPAVKPQGPLSLGLVAQPVSGEAGLIEIRFTVVPRRDVPRLVVRLELPDDLPLVAGPLSWEGPAVGLEPVVLTVRVGPLGEGREVVGRATLYIPRESGPDGTYAWSQSGSIMLEEAPVREPQIRSRRDHRGYTILEVPAQSP
jgi:hypothetical protein